MTIQNNISGEDFSTVALRLGGDVIYLRTAGGVEVRSSAKVISIKGKGSYELLDRLAERLDGSVALEDLCAQLTGTKRNAVHQLCELLLAHGMVRSTPACYEAPPEHAAVIQYLAHHADDSKDNPIQLFEKFRHTPLLLIGTGLAGAAVAHSFIELGLQNIFLAADQLAVGRVAEYVRVAITSGRKVELHSLPVSLETVDLTPFAGVVYLSACADREVLKLLQLKCGALHKKWIAGTIEHGWAIAGPLVGPGVEGCATCARGVLDTICASSGTGPADREPVAGPAILAALANTVAMRMFSHLAGIEQSTLPTVELLDTVSLSPAWFRHSPQSLCRTCGFSKASQVN